MFHSVYSTVVIYVYSTTIIKCIFLSCLCFHICQILIRFPTLRMDLQRCYANPFETVESPAVQFLAVVDFSIKLIIPIVLFVFCYVHMAYYLKKRNQVKPGERLPNSSMHQHQHHHHHHFNSDKVPLTKTHHTQVPHTHTHTQTHTHTHAHTCTLTHLRIGSNTHTHICTYIHTHKITCTHIQNHLHI